MEVLQRNLRREEERKIANEFTQENWVCIVIIRSCIIDYRRDRKRKKNDAPYCLPKNLVRSNDTTYICHGQDCFRSWTCWNNSFVKELSAAVASLRTWKSSNICFPAIVYAFCDCRIALVLPPTTHFGISPYRLLQRVS